MTPTLKDTGCCPICDRTVPRLVRRVGGLLREVYVCPTHGALGYGPQHASLFDWAATFARSPMTN